jgi:hypothetical protein
VACPQWHCRVWARAWSNPGPRGQVLAAGAWQRLEALPDPRSPQGRIYPLACLIAIAVCAFTAAGNDRFTAVGQWVKRASQADLARLRAPWDPIAGRYRAPDEKTIRVVLDRLARGPWPGPCSGRAHTAAGAPAGRGRRRQDLPRGRHADGTRVHLLGAAEHGGRLLDHLEAGVKHNETSHFTELLGSADLAGAVVTFDALHTVRANLDWLVKDNKAHYIAIVKRNQPLLHAGSGPCPGRRYPPAASPATPATAAPRPGP